MRPLEYQKRNKSMKQYNKIFMQRKSSLLNSKHKTRDQIIFLLMILGVWEVIVKLKFYPESLFPSVSTVIERLLYMFFHESLISKIIFSLGIVFFALIVSLIIAFGLVCVSKKINFFKNGISLINGIASPLPGVAVLPIVILWMGISSTSMILIMIHAMVWPLYTTLLLSADRLSSQYSRMIKVFRIDFKTMMIQIYLRGMMPDLLSGIEIAWSRGWRALISIEMIFGIVGKNSGLGWLIYERRMYMDTSGMIAGLVAIAMCGTIFERLIHFAQQREVLS